LDLYNNYDNLKTMIGYVPQSDIVYRELSLQSMLLYSARLRLPKDSLQEELQASVDRVLKQVELSDHRSTLIGRLSGGQRKRASIAVELLSDPQLFFLDEPMSGLDPGTEKHLMKILRQMSRQGKTIIMVTHSTLNLAMFDQILFMGRGGNLCYAGPLQDALNYFKVEDVVDVYQLIDSRGTEYGDRYRQQFLGDRPFIESADQLDATSSYYSRPAAAMQSQKQQPADTAKVAAGKGGGNTAGKLKKSNKGTFFIQLSVLTRRYFELQINDRVRLLINLIQPVLLAVLLALVASDTVFEQYESTKSLLFALICCAYWIGTSDAISEIGKERVIFRREYMTGLRISSYLASKLIVLGALTFLQSALLTGGFAALVGLPESGLFAAPVVDFFITVFLATFAAANIALIVSALFKQQERAQSLAPLLLIPQILFSGSVFKLDGAVEKLSNLAVSRWAMEALGRVSDLNELPRAIDLELEGITLERTLEGFYTHELKALLENWGVLLLFSLVSCVIIALALRRIKNDQD
jgi:ABC-type multidrug transport system ATPase subunit/ABC-type multidrug transport system permease subunit